MDNYKLASRLKLRFATDRGNLAVEQLWELSLTSLAASIRETKKVLKKNDDTDLSFLEEGGVSDTVNELRFEILKDVYVSKKKDLEDERNATENKAHNQKIMSIIQSKKEGALNEMSVEELEKLLK